VLTLQFAGPTVQGQTKMLVGYQVPIMLRSCRMMNDTGWSLHLPKYEVTTFSFNDIRSIPSVRRGPGQLIIMYLASCFSALDAMNTLCSTAQ
jgi:hypothetical protein